MHADSNALYDLFAVIHHSGDSGGGHYVAYAKVSPSEWFKFDDDENVTKKSQLKKAAANEVGGPGAYVLYYRKKKKFLC